MIPWFVATEKFDKFNAAWAGYIAWSGLEQLDEIISLDSSLCPTVLPDIKTEYWSHIVNEDFMLHSLLTSIICAAKQPAYFEKTCSAFFAILLLTPHRTSSGRVRVYWV
jgi:hypothetical protein